MSSTLGKTLTLQSGTQTSSHSMFSRTIRGSAALVAGPARARPTKTHRVRNSMKVSVHWFSGKRDWWINVVRLGEDSPNGQGYHQTGSTEPDALSGQEGGSCPCLWFRGHACR